MSDLIERLRTRAAIRRKATCRGAGDRLANVLDEAADELAALRTELNQQSNVLEEITARAETALVDNIRLRTKLEEATELHTMQLAAITTASLFNTRQSDPPLHPTHPYWTPSYGDVVAAVQREMEWREKAEEAERKLADARREGMEDALLAVQHLRNPYYRGTEAIKHAWEIGVIEATKAIRAKIGEQK